MKRLVLLVLTLSTVFLAVNAMCMPWQDEGRIYFCANLNKTQCNWGSGGSLFCITYSGGIPAVSAYTDGDYNCMIFREDYCRGEFEFVNRTGFSPLPFTVKTFKCPCLWTQTIFDVFIKKTFKENKITCCRGLTQINLHNFFQIHKGWLLLPKAGNPV